MRQSSTADSPFEGVTLGLTLALSSVACAANFANLLVMTCHRMRERNIGMVTLSVLEILVNASLTVYLVCQWALPSREPWQVGISMHGLQMVRNNWLLCIAVYRVVLTMRPRLASRRNLRLPARSQAGVLLTVLGVTTGELLVANFWQGSGSSVGGSGSNSSSSMAEFRAHIYKYMSYAVLGILLPGACMLVISAKIAYSLRVRFAYHRSSKRASKIIMLLSVSFVLCQFPFAVSYVASGTYLLSPGVQSLGDAEMRWLRPFEEIANWSGVFQPIDSSLNFFIFLRYSPTFRIWVLRQWRRLWKARRRPADKAPCVVYLTQRTRRRSHRGCSKTQPRRQCELLELHRFMRPEDQYA